MLILPTAYLPPVSYISALYRSQAVCVEVHENYQKQTLRNRCTIDSPNGPLSLSIPVEKQNGHVPMRDIRISDHGNWRHQHWNALVSSYRQSPFFEYYQDDFAPFYQRKWDFLVDYNQELLQLLCSLIDIQPQVRRTEVYLGLSPVSPEVAALKPYYQVFASKHGFLPDLSVVDLLFNMGPESVLYL